MVRILDISGKCILGCGIALAALAPLDRADAKADRVLYDFKGGHDGRNPSAGLILDGKGNLYGTTAFGVTTGCNEGRGCGSVFKLAPNGAESVRYAFQGGTDAGLPLSSLIADKSGNLYGTASLGGGNYNDCSHACGAVFKVSPQGSETVFYAFKNGSDGAHPNAGLVADAQGNFYGTTASGGNTDTCGSTKDQQSTGCGIVFKVAPNGSETVLHVFTGGSDGGAPAAGLIIDGSGNLYGTTAEGGSSNDCGQGSYGCGTIFKVASNGNETVLYAFSGGSDGAYPAAVLTVDGAGNLYGTTVAGGSKNDCGAGSMASGCGTTFKLAPNGSETVLHAFTGGKDGAYPMGGVVADSAGNFYGTTAGGGSTKNCGVGSFGCGVVFKIASDGTETILHAFVGGKKDGGYPLGGLVSDKKNNLYGTTYAGGAHKYGIVFKLKE